MTFLILSVLFSFSLFSQKTKLSVVGAFGNSFEDAWNYDKQFTPVLEFGLQYQWAISDKHQLHLHTGFLLTHIFRENKDRLDFSGPFTAGQEARIDVNVNTKINYVSIPFYVSIKLNKYRPYIGFQAQLLRFASRLRRYTTYNNEGDILITYDTDLITSYPKFNAELMFGFQRTINEHWSLSFTFYEGIIHLEPGSLLDRITDQYTTSRVSIGLQYTFSKNR